MSINNFCELGVCEFKIVGFQFCELGLYTLGVCEFKSGRFDFSMVEFCRFEFYKFRNFSIWDLPPDESYAGILYKKHLEITMKITIEVKTKVTVASLV